MMIKKLLLASAGAALLMGASVASAKTVEYTFGVAGGGGDYCDGLTLVEAKGVAVGVHTGPGCSDGEGGYAGGVEGGKLPPFGIEDASYFIVTTDPSLGDEYQLYFVVDETALTWVLYYQSTENLIRFVELNSGPLVVGAPETLTKQGIVLSLKSAASAKLQK